MSSADEYAHSQRRVLTLGQEIMAIIQPILEEQTSEAVDVVLSSLVGLAAFVAVGCGIDRKVFIGSATAAYDLHITFDHVEGNDELH